MTLYVNWVQARTECILRFQAPLRAWTCRRHPARSSILWRLTCRRLSARSSVKNKGRAGGTLHVRGLKNKYIGFILCHFPQIGAKVGPNIRKKIKMKLYVYWIPLEPFRTKLGTNLRKASKLSFTYIGLHFAPEWHSLRKLGSFRPNGSKNPP